MSEQPRPPAPLVADLEWEEGRRFRGRSGSVEVLLDSPTVAGPNPMQYLAFAMAGCMAMDVADIVRKGRLELRGLKVHLEAPRATDHPRRILGVHLHFVVEGSIPEDRVERAIQLSRERYCSVSHSIRQDVPFTTSFEVVNGG